MDFYYMDISAPCRSIMLTAKALGITLNKKVLDVLKGEQNTPEFLSINFQHTIPTLVDGDLNLWESRSVCTYLANKYGKDDSLYPKDPAKRFQVDRLLFFDMGTLYQSFGDYVYPVMFGGQSKDETKAEKIQTVLGHLNKFLEGHDWAVGNHITVADFALAASIATMVHSGVVDISGHPNVVSWYNRCKTEMVGFNTENEAGAKEFGKMVKEKFV